MKLPRSAVNPGALSQAGRDASAFLTRSLKTERSAKADHDAARGSARGKTGKMLVAASAQVAKDRERIATTRAGGAKTAAASAKRVLFGRTQMQTHQALQTAQKARGLPVVGGGKLRRARVSIKPGKPSKSGWAAWRAKKAK